MKQRGALVSNSSAASFILDGRELTVRDVARLMIPVRDWEGYQNDRCLEELDKFEGDPNTPMTFGSCNYETFIARHGNLIFVSTCNNHPFYDVLGAHRASDELVSEQLRGVVDEDPFGPGLLDRDEADWKALEIRHRPANSFFEVDAFRRETHE